MRTLLGLLDKLVNVDKQTTSESDLEAYMISRLSRRGTISSTSVFGDLPAGVNPVALH
jgi:hypothetical protein